MLLFFVNIMFVWVLLLPEYWDLCNISCHAVRCFSENFVTMPSVASGVDSSKGCSSW